MNIPKRLQNSKIRFLKIQQGTKRPSESNWQTTQNYSYKSKEFQKYVKGASSCGILCGEKSKGLFVIDCDKKELSNTIFMQLPNTFVTETGSKGHHFFYWILDLDKKIVLQNKKGHFGEVQGTGAQVICPNSIHPNGNKYTVLQNNKIASITKEQLIKVIEPYMKEKKVFVANSGSGMNWDISLVAKTISGLDLTSRGELQGSHPKHGSENGQNFCINLEKNTWFCHRCQVGSDTVGLVAVLEGIVECENLVPGYFKSHPKEFKKTLKVAEEKYGYVNNTYKPQQKEDTLLLFVDKKLNTQGIVKYIMGKYAFITVKDSTSRKPHIYIYQDGYYNLNGNSELEKIIKGIFTNSTWSIHYRNEIMEYIKSENTVDRDEIQPPKHLINVNNGIYDLKTGTLMPHSNKHYFLYKLPIDYKANAKMPKITEYFKSTLKKEYITLSQEIFGYCLYPSYFIAGIFYLYGCGGNGKSVWVQLLTSMLGRGNVASKEISSLMSNRFASSSLYGKLANVCGEMSAGVMKNTDMLKRMSAGDMIDAEFKGRDAFSFPNVAKIVAACNEIPQCEDDTFGWTERQYIMPFLENFRRTAKDNTHLVEQLVGDKEEMEGLLSWAIEGLHRLLKNEQFSYNYDMEERYTMYKDNSKYFIEKNYFKGDFSSYVEVNAIRAEYCLWCKENNVPPDSDVSLARKLEKAGYTLDRFRKESGEQVWIRRFIEKLQQEV